MGKRSLLPGHLGSLGGALPHVVTQLFFADSQGIWGYFQQIVLLKILNRFIK